MRDLVDLLKAELTPGVVLIMITNVRTIHEHIERAVLDQPPARANEPKFLSSHEYNPAAHTSAEINVSSSLTYRAKASSSCVRLSEDEQNFVISVLRAEQEPTIVR